MLKYCFPRKKTVSHELVELVKFVLRKPEALAGGGTHAHTLMQANVNYLRCALIREHMQGAIESVVYFVFCTRPRRKVHLIIGKLKVNEGF